MRHNLATAEGQQAKLDELNGKAVEIIPQSGEEWLMWRLRDPATPKAVKDRIAMRLLKTEKPDLEAVALAREGSFGDRLEHARRRRKAGEAAQREAVEAARAAGDVDGAIALALRDPLEFARLGERPSVFELRSGPPAIREGMRRL